MNKLLLEKKKLEEKKDFSQKRHKIKSGLSSTKSLSPNRKRNIKNNIHKSEKNFKIKYSSENKNRQDKKYDNYKRFKFEQKKLEKYQFHPNGESLINLFEKNNIK